MHRLLGLYLWLICYRHKKFVTRLEGLPLPEYAAHLKAANVRDKARASLAPAGVFFAFSIAVLVALVGSDEIRKTQLGVDLFLQLDFLVSLLLAIVLPYVVIWAERRISEEHIISN